MPNTPLTKDQGQKLVNLMIIGMFCFLALLGYVFYQSYSGREDVVENSRTACDRGKKDRSDNAYGWRTAEEARINSAAEQLGLSYEATKKLVFNRPKLDDPKDLVAARKYNRTAQRLERRSRISCKEAFPDASFFPHIGG